MQNISIISKPSRDFEQFALDNNNDSSNINMNSPAAGTKLVNFYPNLLIVNSVNPKNAAGHNSDNPMLSFQNASSEYETKEIKNNSTREKEKRPSALQRVKVELLQTPSQLQNNVWNHAYQRYTATTRINDETINQKNTTSQNESALITVDKNIKGIIMNDLSSNIEFKCKSQIADCWRSQDQESAFRRIEDVHNYAKLKRKSFSNGSSSSPLECDEDEDEDDGRDVEDDDNEFDVYDEVFDDDCIMKRRNHQNSSKNLKIYHKYCVEGGKNNTTTITNLVKEKNGEMYGLARTPPDHHARRPMNAFLIFCKRHRAIVKEKYKTCENRAITKILGDWWASLDNNEKKCYTNLAKQNKDAFFSANPNFKWYKLPAPPLRTVASRPTASFTDFDRDATCDDDREMHVIHGANSRRSRLINDDSNFFRFADEQQMGELSTLMGRSNSNEKPVTPNSNSALHRVLGETSDFLKITIPHNENELQYKETKNKRKMDNNKRFQTENTSSSSTSSEEEKILKKFPRSCKGKKYQELMSSGQIIAAVANNNNNNNNNNKSKISIKQNQSNLQNRIGTIQNRSNDYNRSGCFSKATNSSQIAIKCEKSSPLHCDNTFQSASMTSAESQIQNDDDLTRKALFDLEDKIKSLPILSLDVYLQRKRNTKKKKINSKRRATKQQNKSSTISKLQSSSKEMELHHHIKELSSPTTQRIMVGSQKRKARKESITRRDINSMETIKSLSPVSDYNRSVQVSNAAPINFSSTEIKIHERNESLCKMFTFANNSFPTSDLLILAEVAANHTPQTAVQH